MCRVVNVVIAVKLADMILVLVRTFRTSLKYMHQFQKAEVLLNP